MIALLDWLEVAASEVETNFVFSQLNDQVVRRDGLSADEGRDFISRILLLLQNGRLSFDCHNNLCKVLVSMIEFPVQTKKSMIYREWFQYVQALVFKLDLSGQNPAL